MKLAPALIAVLALARVASAQEADVSYHVKQGDTLDLIAAEFYGDHAHTAMLIAEENRLKPPFRVYPGERLRIPVTRAIATAKGDTFESVAAQYLGDGRRAAFVADANHMKPTDALPTGTVLVVPFHVAYVAAAQESLAQVATAVFGDPKLADAIRAYNALDKTALDRGESILVPIVAVRTRPEHAPALDAESVQRHDAQTHAIADAAAALPIALAAWRGGDFAGVRDALAPIEKRLDYLETPAAIEVGVLLGKAELAFDDQAGATAIFHEVIARAPGHALSSYDESPKVIEAWRAAGGAVR